MTDNAVDGNAVDGNAVDGNAVERVVLLGESGQALGVADKAGVHGADTPLHLAFSCYVFNSAGQFLLTRRAHGKLTFPGVWTNSCCGHPAPGEAPAAAVIRRVRQELGITLQLGTTPQSVVLLLPRFRYRAEMNGVVENELCPVYAGYSAGPLDPDPAEVADAKWVGWTDLLEQVRANQFQVSPWCALQLSELARLGPDPLHWPAADPATLPSAARF